MMHNAAQDTSHPVTRYGRCFRNGKESSYEAQFYHPDDKKSVSIGLFYFHTEEEMANCEEEAARSLDRVAFKFYAEKGWPYERIQSKLSVRLESTNPCACPVFVATCMAL
jgi:hypothetical protein